MTDETEEFIGRCINCKSRERDWNVAGYRFYCKNPNAPYSGKFWPVTDQGTCARFETNDPTQL